MIDSRSAHFVLNRGTIHTGEIEDVAFNRALQFVATFCAHGGLGSEHPQHNRLTSNRLEALAGAGQERPTGALMGSRKEGDLAGTNVEWVAQVSLLRPEVIPPRPICEGKPGSQKRDLGHPLNGLEVAITSSREKSQTAWEAATRGF